MQTTFSISTDGPGLYEFTREVEAWVNALEPRSALITLLIRHTSASLLIQENTDSDVLTDLQEFFYRMVPPSDDPAMSFVTHVSEGPDDMPAHIRAAMLPVSLSIPITNGRMRLGTWQGIHVFEHRHGPRVRQVAAHIG